MSALLQLQDGQLLLFGGRSESQRALQDTWLYDIPRYVLVSKFDYVSESLNRVC
jgi:hypothetical protein